jgi:Uma2 family endonuclease
MKAGIMAAFADAHQSLLTADEFLAFLDRQQDQEKWALIEGTPTMMTRGNRRHALIIGNIYTALRPLARAVGCEAIVAELLITSPVNKHFAAAPDVFVRCGPAAPLARRLDDPVLVFEVLSPTTMSLDRGYKFEQYAGIPTLEQIVFVYQDEVRVESWTRAEPQWSLDIVQDRTAAFPLPRFGSLLPRSTIYEDTGLD